MKRTINFIAVALALAACATAPKTAAPQAPAPPLTASQINRERLHVVTDAAVYRQQVQQDPDKQLVELTTLGIPIQVRYATDRNFMKRKLYPEEKAFLRAPAARALVDVQKELAPLGIGIKVWDAYRPYSVTEAMWEQIQNPDYVADPAQGSRHNRGAAVDLTLVFLNPSDVLTMPTAYDDFTPRARHDFMKLPKSVLGHREQLKDVMTRHGFEPLPSEWWHYDFKGWEGFEVLDLPFDAL
jgi:D-alanyl-D-alanine dipeptidase